MKKTILILFIVIIIFGGYWFVKNSQAKFNQSSLEKQEEVAAEEIIETEYTKDIEITEGATYGELMRETGIDYGEAMEIYNLAKDQYDLIKIRQGRSIELVFDKATDDFVGLKYEIDSEDELIVTKNIINNRATSTEEVIDKWKIEVIPIPYEIKVKVSGGEVASSMYQAALDNDIDERAIIELANAFQWSIDFAMDPRIGDTFKFIYEERYLDGEYVMPGRVLAGFYVNDGKKFEVYYFEESEDNKGYFDQDGNSVQKMFLKAPVEFRYISSGYTIGNRVVMEVGLSGPHRAIDYAAALGTPIRAVGDGTVSFAGWNSHGYGNLTSIRHNETYSTNYAHQSKIIVKVGQKVKQGDVIGYVGSTGFSTGPHIHFEMVKNGVKINPLKEILPPGKPIKDDKKEEFTNVLEKYRELLKNN